MLKKINAKIILSVILLAIIVGFALFFVFQLESDKYKEPQPKDKIIAQDETSKFYQELSKTAIGTKKYIDSFTLVENLGDGKFRAEISSVPQVTQNGKEINVAWTQKEEGIFNGGNNFFTVSVNNARTMVSALSDVSENIKKGDSATWNPQIFLNEKEVNVISKKPILLENDPYNENYYNNVLEWDYGILKRRLEITESSVFELYSIAENPKGDLVIRSNSEGNLRGGAYYALDGNGKNLRGFRFTDGEKILDSDVLDKAIYPIIVDDSFSGTNAGYLEGDGNGGYSVVRSFNGSGCEYSACVSGMYGGHIDVGQGSLYDPTEIPHVFFRIYRGYVTFDTSAIVTGSTINSAQLSLYCNSKYFGSRTGVSFSVQIQSGQPTYPHLPLINTDYYMGYYSGNGGSISTNSLVVSQYNNISLNSTGLGWITKGGITKFLLRSSNDINNTPPPTPTYSGNAFAEEIYFAGISQSSTMPKLIVNFTLPAVPTISITPSPSFYFGTVNVGSNGDYAFTVKNTGGGTLSGSVSGLSASFSCISGCSYNLAAGASQTTTLRFTPASVGSFSGTAKFNSNASNVNIALTGDGALANCIPDFATGNYTVNNTALGGTNTCVIKSGATVGTEGGDLTVSSGITIQMNTNSLWLFNAGKSIFVNGIIAKPYRTAIIRKGNLSGPTVSVALSASPSSGTAPLNGVDLTATVSGTATGNTRYQFDCTNNGSWEADTTISNTSYTATDLCNYSSVGTYTAKARVTRSGVTAEDTETITVSSGCVCSGTSGCCDGCNYRLSSYICNSGTEYDYRCSGVACGNDAQRQSRSYTQYCSGSSATCNGLTNYGSWSSWSTIDDCASTEKCSTDNSTYASCNYDASCVVSCTNECSSSGCSGTTHNNCYDSDGDGCTEINPTSCSTSCYSCGDGTCNSACGETSSNCLSDCQMYCHGGCETNSSGQTTGICQSGNSPTGCGAPSQCDGRSAHTAWITGNTCNACGFCSGECCTTGTCAFTAYVNCAYSTDTTKENSYLEEGDTCYYGCTNTCHSDLWTAQAVWSVYSDVDNGFGVGTPNCTSNDDNKLCSGSVCSSTGWNNSSCNRVVFVTSNTYNGNLGGASGAGIKCQTAAILAGLPGDFEPWISTPAHDAKDYIDNAKYVDTKGNKIVDNLSDLTDGSIDNKIQYSENGTLINDDVWTGTRDDGTARPETCNGWTSNSSSVTGRNGETSRTGYGWTSWENNNCNLLKHLYCFQVY